MKKFFAERNSKFVNLFRGKRVAIVSGATVDKNYGPEIDACDVVVRLNNCHERFPYPPEFMDKYGSRCDVLIREANDFHLVYATTKDPSGWIEKLRSMGIKNVYFFTGNRHAEFNHLGGGNPEFGCLDPYVFEFLKACIGQHNKVPSTGLVALTALALSEPKELLVVGFSFYQTGYYDNAYYIDPGVLNPIHMNLFHDFRLELSIFNDVVRKLCNTVFSLNLVDFFLL